MPTGRSLVIYYADVSDVRPATCYLLTFWRICFQSASGARCRLATDTMNQLQRFTGGDNVTTRFSYYSNTGLIESRDDHGSLRLVEYDDVGHVTSLVLANGRRVWLNEGEAKVGRACFDISSDVSTVAMTIGDSGTTFSRGI